MFLSRFALIGAAAAILAGLFESSTSWAAGPQIWFGPHNPVHNSTLNIGSDDYQKLFEPDADWQKSRSAVSVFKITPVYVLDAPDADLQKEFSDLNRHHIALAMETGLLPGHPGCPHLEGHGPDTQSLHLQVTQQIAQRIKRLGGDLAYVAADEPLWFGHSVPTKAGCDLDLNTLAQQAAASARVFRSVFPKVQFVDIEPVTNFKDSDANVASLISRWDTAFASAFGEPFRAVDFDIWWPLPSWPSRVRAVVAQLRHDRMPVGVICNGTSKDPTDATWLANAKMNCDDFNKAIGGAPDVVIFQSWNAHPTRVLPETNPDSFTHLILDYIDSRRN